jgi:MoxR-like ATPase
VWIATFLNCVARSEQQEPDLGHNGRNLAPIGPAWRIGLQADSSEAVAFLAADLEAAVGQVIVGKEAAVRLAIVTLLARGHLLIEDVPGTGKTTLARALARVLGASFRRIQFTPDLLPADIVGVNIYDAMSGAFVFRPGPVFAEVVLADEINRATPRTQSALLEAMQEGQVSLDGETHALHEPFLVLATQNPVEMDGTFRLPEAQLDRFLVRVEIGYPDAEEEDAMLARFEGGETQWDAIGAVTTPDAIRTAQTAVSRVTVGAPVRSYIGGIVRATREHDSVRLGASPRASLALQRAAQARAAMDGRTYLLPDDVKSLAPSVLGHRIVVETSAQLRGLTGTAVVWETLDAVPVPMASDEEKTASAP